MLSLFKRAGSAGSQIGVFVTDEGVAAAQVTKTARGRGSNGASTNARADSDPVARVLARLPNRARRRLAYSIPAVPAIARRSARRAR